MSKPSFNKVTLPYSYITLHYVRGLIGNLWYLAKVSDIQNR